MKSSYRFLSQNGSRVLLAMIFTLSLVNTSEAYWGTGMYYANPACMVAGGGVVQPLPSKRTPGALLMLAVVP